MHIVIPLLLLVKLSSIGQGGRIVVLGLCGISLFLNYARLYLDDDHKILKCDISYHLV